MVSLSNSFKAGYLQTLEDMLTDKAPGHGIGVFPFIQSWIKTLKNGWQTMYDLVYGVNTRGFEWDSEKKCVTVEPAVWNAYLQVDYASILVLSFGRCLIMFGVCF